MGSLNTYILRQAVIIVAGLMICAVSVLLLERLLRIFQVVANSISPANDAFTMLSNLLPHYLGFAVPLSVLLGGIITIDRISRTSELTAAMGAGVSLFHMTKPFLLIAGFLCAFVILLEGWLQPLGRYNYREVLQTVKQQSFAAILRQGTFTEVGNYTFHAGTENDDGVIGPVFIYEKVTNSSGQIAVRISSAEKGDIIIRDETRQPVLQMAGGTTYQIMSNRQLDGDFSFQATSIAGDPALTLTRPRGKDERELTTLELVKNSDGALYPDVNENLNAATLHHRLSHAALILILPFLAVPFGLNYGRNPSSAGIVIGVVMMVSIQKSLEFMHSLGAEGVIPPWSGVWGVIALVAIIAGVIFYRSAYKQAAPPLASFGFYLGHMIKTFRKAIAQVLDIIRRRPRHA